jgi:hypothetical protein
MAKWNFNGNKIERISKLSKVTLLLNTVLYSNIKMNNVLMCISAFFFLISIETFMSPLKGSFHYLAKKLLLFCILTASKIQELKSKRHGG